MSLACQFRGPPNSDRAKKAKRKAARWRNFCFLLLEKEPKNKLPVADSLPEFLRGSDT